MRNVSVFLTGFFIPVLILYLVRSRRLSLRASRSACALLNILLGYLIFTAFCEHFHINWLVFPQYILDPTIGIHPERARGPVVNAAENGAIIAILMLTALHQILYANIGVVRRAASLGLLLFGIPALWFTETRGPWLGLTAGLFVMLWHKRSKGLVLALGAAGVVALAAVILLSGVSVTNLAKVDLLPQRAENTADTTDFRLDLYRESLGPFQDHPVIGWGLGTFTDEDYLFDAYGHSLTIGSAVLHDTALAITLESGVIGAILYISFLVGMFLSLLRLRRATRNFEKRDFYTMCIATLTVFIIDGIFVDSRYFMPQNALVFLIAGLGLSLPPTDRLRLEKSVPGPDAAAARLEFPAIDPDSASVLYGRQVPRLSHWTQRRTYS
jgi:O-antigen ligase